MLRSLGAFGISRNNVGNNAGPRGLMHQRNQPCVRYQLWLGLGFRVWGTVSLDKEPGTDLTR